MFYNKKMKIESNCIGYAFYTLGLIDEERVENPDYYDRLIKPWFREVNRLAQAQALAVVVKAPPHLVIHMMVVNRQDPFLVSHRPREGRPVVTERVFRALDFYSNGLREGQLRIAKLSLLNPSPNI